MDFDPICPHCNSTNLDENEMEFTSTQAWQNYDCLDCGCEFYYSGDVSIKWYKKATITHLEPEE